MRHVILLLIVAIIANACQTGEVANIDALKDQFPHHSLIYELPSWTSEASYLLGNPGTGELLLVSDKLGLLNEAETFTLSTQEGSYPTADSLFTIDQKHLVVRFKSIVNNRSIYKITGYGGDMLQEYRLETPLHPETLIYELSSAQYDSYKEAHGREQDIKLFKLSTDITGQAAHQQNLGITNFVHLSDHELTAAGINLHIYAWQVDDTLYLSTKIINHSELHLKVMPHLFLTSGNTIHSSSFAARDSVLLRKGERHIEQWQYTLDDYHNLRFNNNSIIINLSSGSTSPLLAQSIELVEFTSYGTQMSR